MAILFEHRTKFLIAAACALTCGVCFSTAAMEAGRTLDRVVASVGSLAITQSDVEAEYRFERFLEGHIPSELPDSQSFNQVRERLVEQTLLALEAGAEASGPPHSPVETAAALAQVRDKYAKPQDYETALRALGLEETQVLKKLALRQRILEMIDQRFRPETGVEAEEIDHYYRETFVPDCNRRGQAAPPLPQVETQITEILVQQKINARLANWLEELRVLRRARLHQF